MATKSPKCTSLPNEANYYWEQALISFENKHLSKWAEHESYMYLILFYIAILGD